ncbi:competence protein ComK [Halobacillus salinarum]|uniref:Competence protein ComK n=1 Tax=Halobacillus salinarum TaxID=2932257 RepID=A0ABY4EH79_9BACI|nr:competence protein ComK [Halobacillus salinarum]UOQ43486.1 competence protein ComK [Halobacillus salinarum]
MLRRMDVALKTEYEVNPQTMALIAEYNEVGQVITKVMEKKECFYLSKYPGLVIDESCHYFGSSLEGQISGTKQVAGFTHKPPIVISSAMGMYFFPIISPKRKECSWIAHNFIRSYKAEEDQTTTLYFFNGTTVHVPVSEGMIANQVQRTAQFRFILEDRLRHSAVFQSERVAEPYA